MANEIKTKVAVDGEAEYKKSLANITQQAKTLDSEMKLLTSSFTKEGNAKKQNQQKTEVLTKQIEVQKQKVDLLKNKLEESKKQYGENATQTLKLQESLNKAQTSLNQMTGELQKNNSGFKLFKSGADEAGKSAISFGDIVKANVVSDLIKSGLSSVASLVKDIATNMVNTAQETINWADDLATLSTTTGLSTDTLQEMEFYADLLDTDISTVTGSMKKLINNMDSARDGSGAAAKAFEALGVSVTDSDGQLRDSETVFYEVIDALGQIPNETERDAKAMDIFGKSAQDLNPLIKAGSGAIQEYANQAHEMGFVLSEDMIGNLTQADDSLAILKNQFTAMSRGLMAEVAPAISEVADLIGSMFTGDADPEVVAQKGVDIVFGLADQILGSLPRLIETAPQLINGLITGLVNRLPQILNTGVQLLMSLVNGIIRSIPTLVGSVPQIISALVGAIVRAIPQLASAGMDLVRGLWQGISNGYGWITSKISEWCGSVINWIKSRFGIHSPSTETAWMGEMLGQGLANGILDSQKVVNAAWGKLTGAVGTVNMSATGRGSGAAVINIYQREGENSLALAERINRQLGRVYA